MIQTGSEEVKLSLLADGKSFLHTGEPKDFTRRLVELIQKYVKVRKRYRTENQHAEMNSLCTDKQCMVKAKNLVISIPIIKASKL